MRKKGHYIDLFRIVGETKEAVKEARNKLEYSELVIEVDRNIACEFSRTLFFLSHSH